MPPGSHSHIAILVIMIMIVILVMIAILVIMIMIVILVIISIPSDRLLTPILLKSDLAYCLLMAALAISNGYLTRFTV